MCSFKLPIIRDRCRRHMVAKVSVTNSRNTGKHKTAIPTTQLADMTVFFMPACLRAGKSSVARRGLSRNGVYMRVHAYRKKPQTTTPQAIAIFYRRRIFRSPLGSRNARRGAYMAYVSTERFAADTAVGEKD